jgi:hypothetical protein
LKLKINDYRSANTVIVYFVAKYQFGGAGISEVASDSVVGVSGVSAGVVTGSVVGVSGVSAEVVTDSVVGISGVSAEVVAGSVVSSATTDELV